MPYALLIRLFHSKSARPNIWSVARVFALCLFSALGALSQTTNTFSNPNPIVINDNSTAAPYPSQITVPGPSCIITKLTVALNGFNHFFPDDAGVLLVGPTGVKVRLMTDSGGPLNLLLDPADLVFSSGDIPPAPFVPDEGPFNSGTYRPSEGVLDGASSHHQPNFLFPAPPGPYSLTLSDFNASNQMGAWQLYTDDDTAEDGGSIDGGWSLTITCQTPTAARVSIGGRVTAPNGRGITRANVYLTGANGETLAARTNPFGYFRFEEVGAGETHTVAVRAKDYLFEPQVVTVNDDLWNLDFVGEPRALNRQK